MSAHVIAEVCNRIGVITLDRPKALNALSLDMIRALTASLLAWSKDDDVIAVLVRSSSERSFCAGGDIRFFYEAANSASAGESALIEDFFTEEYSLNHLIHHYPKPYIALMNGIVMGGGMGISRAGRDMRIGIVTETTSMAMPEVHIGLFPDIGGSHFLSRMPGKTGTWLALTGISIGAADALYSGLADCYLPAFRLPELLAFLTERPLRHAGDVMTAVQEFAATCPIDAGPGVLEKNRQLIDRHFSHATLGEIMASLERDGDPFASMTLAAIGKGSPLMLQVTLEQLQRGAGMPMSDCLRMERMMMRHVFEGREALEGIRARVIEKDNAPQWSASTLKEVNADMVAGFFAPVWPGHAHPLRHL